MSATCLVLAGALTYDAIKMVPLDYANAQQIALQLNIATTSYFKTFEMVGAFFTIVNYLHFNNLKTNCARTTMALLIKFMSHS